MIIEGMLFFTLICIMVVAKIVYDNRKKKEGVSPPVDKIILLIKSKQGGFKIYKNKYREGPRNDVESYPDWTLEDLETGAISYLTEEVNFSFDNERYISVDGYLDWVTDDEAEALYDAISETWYNEVNKASEEARKKAREEALEIYSKRQIKG